MSDFVDNPPTTPGVGQDQIKDEADLARKWCAEVAAARQREKNWRANSEKIIRLYECDDAERSPFNILYSNTETLQPALYNEVPRPEVKPRFKDSKDPVPRYAAKVGKRTLEFLLDTGDGNYPSFDDSIKSAVLSTLLPGRGVTWFKYEAEIETAPPAEGETTEPTESVTYETVCGNDVPWENFLHGYAKQWKDVPWICRVHTMTPEELDKQFGEKGRMIPTGVSDSENDSPQRKDMFAASAGSGTKANLADVFEIWDKVRKKVLFVSPSRSDVLLKEVDDPLKLQDFYPVPKPLRFFATLSSLLPVPLYKSYQNQAEELNITTKRIEMVTKALKVRGFYDSSMADMDKVTKADDNQLIPVQNAMAILSQGGGLDKLIWLMPLQELVAVLQQLMQQRSQIKAVIYEITGIADIMRGASSASETLGAQELKSQWGTLRLKRMQKEVARYCRDCLRIMLEIAVTKFSQETIVKMTGLEFPTEMQKQQLGQVVAQAQQALQQSAQQAQATGQQPPPPPPEVAQQLAQVQETLQMPSWEQLLASLKDDVQRNYSIDIETNSTVDIEATEDKKDLAELLNAISQFLNGVAPLIENQVLPFEAAQGMLVMILRRFRMGDDVEDLLKGMKPPAPQDDGKAAALEAQTKMQQEAHQQEMQSKQADQQAKQADNQAKGQLAAQQLQLDQQRLANEERSLQMELAFKEREHQLKMAELEAKATIDTAKNAQALQLARQRPTQPQQPARKPA